MTRRLSAAGPDAVHTPEAAAPTRNGWPGSEADRSSLRAFLDSALDAVVVIDRRTCIVEFNHAAERLFGYAAADVLGERMAELLVPPRLREAHERGVRGYMEAGEQSAPGGRLKVPALRADGSEIPVELGIARVDLGGEPLFAAFLRDLSETMRFEAHLREAEERNRRLVERLPLVTYIEHLDSESASYISPQIETLLGYTPAEWTSDPEFFRKVLHPDDRDRVLAGFARMHATGEPFDCEYRIVARDGRLVWIHDGAVVIRDAAGGPAYAQGFMVDMTERKQTEQHVRDLVSGIDVIVWEADTKFNFTFVSRRAEDILGYPTERWLSDPGFIVAECLHPEDRERIVAADLAAIETGEDYELEFRMIAADGRTVWFREIVRIQLDEAGKAQRLRGVMVDVTAQKSGEERRLELEAQLRQAQKMEAVGRLAGGIAHDFNNLLTAMMGYSSLALARLGGAESELAADLAEIREASERAAALTQQLLAFSRQQVMSRKVLDVNDVLLNVERLLHRLIGEDIELVAAAAPEPLLVEADLAQLEQVLINLAINARDAMPSGGRLLLQSSRCTLDEASARALPGARAGTFAVLAVADTGHGIADDVRPHLFEPFFTTKEVGKGTGLGLATVYGTVQQSHGFIAVESEAGAGATFRVYLPLSTQAAAAEDDAVRPERPRGAETILLVEDQELVRNLTRQALEREGYRVVAASSPAEALAAEDEGFDLLLTDIVMPGMRGSELADRLVARQPGLKVLFMSGYPDGEAVLGGDTQPRTAFLQKPFAVDELAARVREVLGA